MFIVILFWVSRMYNYLKNVRPCRHDELWVWVSVLEEYLLQDKPFSDLRMESSPVENLRDPSPVDARRLLTSGAVPSALLDCKGVCDT